MERGTSLVVFSILAASLIPRTGAAAVPDAAMSSVPDVITLSPGPGYGGNPIGTFTVTILDALGAACVGVEVEITFPSGADALVAWAPGQDFTQTTDGSGVATFTFDGGGCVTPAGFGATVAEIYADGFLMDDAWINSPDAMNSLGQFPTDISGPICEEGGVTRVGLSDVVFRTDAIKGALVDPCTKFTPPFGDPVGIGDAVFLTPYLRNGNEGTCSP